MSRSESPEVQPLDPEILTEEQRDLVKALIYPGAVENHVGSPAYASITEDFKGNATHDLGLLQVFPNEILTAIIADLDLESCFRLRQVNRKAREMVTSVPTYRLVAEHAFDLFGSTLRGGLGRWRTLRDLEELLRQEHCHRCGRFGDSADPLHWERTCPRCSSPVDVISCHRAAGILKISIGRLRKLVPIMKGSVQWYRFPTYTVTRSSIQQLFATTTLRRPIDDAQKKLDVAPMYSLEKTSLPYIEMNGAADWGGTCKRRSCDWDSHVVNMCSEVLSGNGGLLSLKEFHDHIAQCERA